MCTMILLLKFVHEAMRSMHGSSKIPRKSMCQVVVVVGVCVEQQNAKMATLILLLLLLLGLLTIEGRQGWEKPEKV